MLAVLLPLMQAYRRPLYVWIVRRRLVYWYRQLKALERSLDSGGAQYDPAAHQAEFERIDFHVRRLRVPLYFSGSSTICADTSIWFASDLPHAHRTCAWPPNSRSGRQRF